MAAIWYRFWYHGAYVDVTANTAEQAKAKLKGLATVTDGKVFACVPITTEPERMEE